MKDITIDTLFQGITDHLLGVKELDGILNILPVNHQIIASCKILSTPLKPKTERKRMRTKKMRIINNNFSYSDLYYYLQY